MRTRVKTILFKPSKFRIKRILIGVLFVFWLFCLPSKLFDEPTSTVVESSDGTMLGARIADDGQWRFPRAQSVPERFESCILYFEDEYFYYHPGFNPVSIAKALWSNLTTNKRRGGSTITQQVIRLSRKNKARSYREKLIEMFMATRLEAGYSKKEILSLYASNAPFGGNVVGLETASWRYYGIPANELGWGQSAALAVLPNAPTLVFPGKNEAILRQKRDRLLAKLFKNEVIDRTTYELALEERLPGKPYPLPELAPHLTEKIKKLYRGERVTTTIDLELQRKANQIAKEHYNLLSQNGIHNLAVLIMEVESRKIVAYVGNAPTSADHNNYVDIIDKRRSTGSVLKPLLYTSLLDGGEILPNTLVADVPTVINGYSPENFDKAFNGAVPASRALSRSLNVPAVRMLRSYGLQRFYDKLEDVQMESLDKPAEHYGLSLILGGAESSLWEITKTYAGLAGIANRYTASSSEYNTIEFPDPVFVQSEQTNFGERSLKQQTFNAGSVYNTLAALMEVNRPSGQENWQFFSDAQPIAWKTGTSFGFKDAWAVGVTPKYAIGVWVGNADGEGRPGLTGIQAAAPVFFEILDELPKSRWFDIPYDELTEVEVCSKSGHLTGIYCAASEKQWIPNPGLRTEPCPYHQQIFLDKNEIARVNSSCYSLSEMVQKSWFSLPPVMEYYYARQHPEYKVLPPFMAACQFEGDNKMDLIFPKRNEVILLPKDFEEEVGDVVLKLAHRTPDTTVYWYLDATYIGSTETFHELPIAPKPGSYLLTVTDKNGNELSRKIEIALASPYD